MSGKIKILVVEDDPNIRLGLREILSSEGFTVVACERGDEAPVMIEKEKPGLVVLDVMLPGLSGYEICKQVRQGKNRVPILMLTAKGQEMDKVIGLETGADDYVTKPFGLRELVARIHALLRRSTPEASTSAIEPFTIGKCTVDPKTFQLKRGRETEDLTEKEVKLLDMFRRHPGEVLSRDRLLNDVWGYEYYGTTRTLDQTIVQLRRKLGDDGAKPQCILTVHGVGYKLAG